MRNLLANWRRKGTIWCSPLAELVATDGRFDGVALAAAMDQCPSLRHLVLPRAHYVSIRDTYPDRRRSLGMRITMRR